MSVLLFMKRKLKLISQRKNALDVAFIISAFNAFTRCCIEIFAYYEDNIMFCKTV